ncbi:hypothetical protein MCUN1_000481 [Malassezia cuniculi]|uniref:Uncharacterized protein n=1 Tax=Malassezia cuniculi TaxID=948313 RepID=A0AAF0EW04_9BASI|nr:hypothetical protein MCUN1_000481 [Malassezia cuniculi]
MLHACAARAYSTGRRVPRIYRYWIDVHGQLFLYDTVPKNLTSCFKSVQFLNFFFNRVERVPGVRRQTPAQQTPPVQLPPFDAPHWSDDPAQVSEIMADGGWDALRKRLHADGFSWQSKCQGELNVIHAVDTPVVFRTLGEDGTLTWGGDFTMALQPDKLLVHPETGYLYHPSPTGLLGDSFGPYSLVSSTAVLQRLADGLDVGDAGPMRTDAMDIEQRARQDQLRSAKRALRLFQQRRTEQARRRSRTLRSSISLAAGTQAVPPQTNTQSSQQAARSRRRSSRTLSSLFERRSPRTDSMQRWSQLGSPPTSASASASTSPKSKRASRHVRSSSQFLGSTFVGSRPASVADSRRMSIIANMDSNRRSRHARMSSIATKRESSSLMNGQTSPTKTNSRESLRFSRLEAASILFGEGPRQLPSGKIDWRAKLREVQLDETQDRASALDRLEGRSPPRVVSMSLEPASQPPKREPSWLCTEETKGQKDPSLDTLAEEPSILESSISHSSITTPERRPVEPSVATATPPQTQAAPASGSPAPVRPSPTQRVASGPYGTQTPPSVPTQRATPIQGRAPLRVPPRVSPNRPGMSPARPPAPQLLAQGSPMRPAPPSQMAGSPFRGPPRPPQQLPQGTPPAVSPRPPRESLQVTPPGVSPRPLRMTPVRPAALGPMPAGAVLQGDRPFASTPPRRFTPGGPPLPPYSEPPMPVSRASDMANTETPLRNAAPVPAQMQGSPHSRNPAAPLVSTPDSQLPVRVPKTVPQLGQTPPRGLRPLRLSSAPRTTTKMKEVLTSPLADRPRQNSLQYNPPASAPIPRTNSRIVSTPVRVHSQRRTNSSTVSHAPSIFGSPQSLTDVSHGETSVESMSPIKYPPSNPLADRLAAAEKANQETQHKLTSVMAERDAAAARCSELALELDQLRATYEDTAAERDMHKDDIDGWRHRCSELEHTIQQQQLRLKQEQTWRHAAQRRMQALTERMHSSSATSRSDRSQCSSISSLSDAESDLSAMPPLPSMPTDNEIGDWSLQVARQLSRHAASDAQNDPTPETVRLLSDMRQQIMTLVAELELERSEHQSALSQLENLRAQQHIRRFSSEASASSASPSTPVAEHAEDLWNTPRPPRRDNSAEANKSRRNAFALNAEAHPEMHWLSKIDTPRWLEEEPAAADTLAEHRESGEAGTLAGLGLGPQDRFNKPLPAHPEPPRVEGLFDDSLLDESLDLSTSRRRSSHISWPATDPEPDYAAAAKEDRDELSKRTSLAVDLEVAATGDDEWESEDEDDAPPVQLTDHTKRPEFIPEWSFDQAVFEAKREMDAYRSTGRQAGKLARRGHARLCHEPLDDFFGIFQSKVLPALPLPEHALAPPPLDDAALARLGGASKAPIKATIASPALAPRPYVPTDTFLDFGEDLPEPAHTRPSAIAQMLSWRPWRAADQSVDDDAEEQETSFGLDVSYDEEPYSTPLQEQYAPDLGLPELELPNCRTPPPRDDGLLAPAVPPPSTPAQRSPIAEPPSPSGRGRRYLRPSMMMRIPVPTPAWCLDFESTTSAPNAPGVFTI